MEGRSEVDPSLPKLSEPSPASGCPRRNGPEPHCAALCGGGATAGQGLTIQGMARNG